MNSNIAVALKGGVQKLTDRPTKKIKFKPRARIIRTIGDQLISGPEAAVIELVKNAYDADASKVIVKFIPPLVAGDGRIIVIDDGHGMAVDDIQEKWMEPATSSKVKNRKSRSGKRIMLGSKGIGRFAAAKLGQKMDLISISENETEKTEVLITGIDWEIFSEEAYLSDISIDYLDQPTDGPTGTTIEISSLNENWPKDKMTRLFLELRRLISPLHWKDDDSDFRIILDLSECRDENCGFDGGLLMNAQGSPLEDQKNNNAVGDFEVRPFPLMNTCDYQVEGHFDKSGTFHGDMEIKRAGQSPREIDLKVPVVPEEEDCGRVDVQLYIFDREADVIKTTMQRAGLGEITAAHARAILDEIAGIAIYRDGFRIRPYGDQRNDWLALDSRRVQDPSLRIGHNQVAGYLSVDDQAQSSLIERSSREGFEENASFLRLRRLVRELLAKVVEPRRQDFRENAGLSRKKDTTFDEARKVSELKSIRNLVTHLPKSERAEAEKVIDKQAAILSSKIEQLEDRQRLLEAKSSLGAIVGEILHEGAPDAKNVAYMSSWLKSRLPLLLTKGPHSDDVKREFPERLGILVESGAKLRNLFASLRPLAGGKRGAPSPFNVVNAIYEAKGIFETHNIPISVIGPNELVELIGFKPDLNTALVNLLSNAIYWLEQSNVNNPKIELVVTSSHTEATIVIEDNGPGIPDEFAAKIFNIRFTLKDDGTGLGLNIAQEALARSGAKLLYHRDFNKGAKFEIRFPRYQGGDT